MKIIYDPRHVFYTPKSKIENNKFVDHHDTSECIENLISTLSIGYKENFIKPKDFPRSYLYLVHEADYIFWLKNKSKSLSSGEEYFPKVFGYDRVYDNQTPIMSNTFEMAWISVKNALTGADLLLKYPETSVFSLTRPGGIHAGISIAGGGCYLNNAALAARYIQSKTNGFIAILNLNLNHANGTQEIFYNDSNVLTISIHINPVDNFPYTCGFEWEIGEEEGRSYNINFPIDRGSDGRTFKRVLEKAILEIDNFEPDFLIITLGNNLDTVSSEAKLNLSNSDLVEIGKMLSSTTYKKLIIYENGTNERNNETVSNFISTFE
ncbi:hypothetical protein [Geotoga petraea]|jgi:acetoin utilization deacetylase AcuC-like enzyme|uniref:Acetoin utilization deacetylase AcuC n=1 Tax=Geotoga petraea TaxID=28234 RepID=A0A1G6IF98_9BACT|nr:hypothetical protein [Geotoga petraea]MDK2946739.1 hypothetical protein [Geotoga sp.]SDC05063.1 Acetoin utilization deacetylase AcuC [Geotoga petraea]